MTLSILVGVVCLISRSTFGAEFRTVCEGASCEEGTSANRTQKSRVEDLGASSPKPAGTIVPSHGRAKRPISKDPGNWKQGSNLPTYLALVNQIDFVADGPGVIYPEDKLGDELKGAHRGDRYWAVIDQTLTVSSHDSNPVVATISQGPFEGAVLYGSASLDPALKRVFIEFSSIRPCNSQVEYDFKAEVLNEKGDRGLEGEYSAGDTAAFIAEVGTAASAGYADATINRSQTAFGSYVQEPSVSNNIKQGIVTGLSKAAERSAERARNAPESTHIEGPIRIQVLIKVQPRESRS